MSFRRAPYFTAAVLIAGCLAALAAAQTATSAPQPATTQAVAPENVVPTTLPAQALAKPASEADLQNWFNDLAATDAAVRERAFSSMLGLTRADLAPLRRIVERSRPVAPSQRGPLRDIVTHVYLSGEPYPAEPSAGFLGLMIPTLDSVDVRRSEQPDEFQIADNAINGGIREVASTGVPIEYRIPGFCAFRALREGDVILSIVRPVPRRLREWSDLSPTIRRFRAGDVLAFEVLRQGKVLEITIKLDALPLKAAENTWMSEVLPARDSAAEDYWNEHFAGLMDDRVSGAGAAGSSHASTAIGAE